MIQVCISPEKHPETQLIFNKMSPLEPFKMMCLINGTFYDLGPMPIEHVAKTASHMQNSGFFVFKWRYNTTTRRVTGPSTGSRA